MVRSQLPAQDTLTVKKEKNRQISRRDKSLFITYLCPSTRWDGLSFEEASLSIDKPRVTHAVTNRRISEALALIGDQTRG